MYSQQLLQKMKIWDDQDCSNWREVEKESAKELLVSKVQNKFNNIKIEVEDSLFMQFICAEITNKFTNEFKKLIEDLPEKIKFFIEDNFIFPTFSITKKVEGFSNDYLDYFLTFDLPKPLSKFWWKGGVDSWGFKGVDLNNTGVIKWGDYYRELMPILWDAIGFGFDNDEEKISVFRMNSIGEHSGNYYVWGIYKERN